jgi:hypothetical protein
MSWQATSAVLLHSKARGSARLVMLCIANYAGVDGSGAYPSNKTICENALLSERGVRYIIAKLVESGELVKEEKCGRGNINCYRINLPFASGDGSKVDALKGAKFAPLPISKRGKVEHEKGQASVLKGAIAVAPELYEQSINQKKGEGPLRSPAPSRDAKQENLDTWDRKRLMDWIDQLSPQVGTYIPNREQELFARIKKAAERVGLSYTRAKELLKTYDVYRKWQWIEALDSQQEIEFPEDVEPDEEPA